MQQIASATPRHQAVCLASNPITQRSPITTSRFTPTTGPHLAVQSSRRHAGPLSPAASSREPSQEDIQNLNRDYCDDFVCTSSPSIESTIRSLARDILRANGVWTRSLLSRNVEYSDGVRRFKGPEGYSRLNFVPKYVQQASTFITNMKMVEGKGNVAEIAWRLTGQVGPFSVDVDMTTKITMNLLTGQIERHEDSYSTKRCSPPAAAAFSATRALWAAQSGGAEVAEATGSMLDSLTSVDEDDNNFSAPNPNDPMKFFQQKDNFKDDAFQYGAFLLLVWVMVQAYTTLFQGKM